MSESDIASFIFSEELYLLEEPIIIVIPQPWQKLSEKERNQLSKILAALKLTPDKIRLIYQPQLILSQLPPNSTHVIAFGLTLDGATYNENIVIEKTNVLLSESLSVLLTNDEVKKKFWLALKAKFNI